MKLPDAVHTFVMVDGAVMTLARSEAARRRLNEAHRRELIAELGWKAEDGTTPGDRYLASTIEMTRWINEARAKAGTAPRPFQSFDLASRAWAFGVKL